MIKRNILVILCIMTGFLLHYFVSTNDIKSYIDSQTTTLNNNILTIRGPQQQCASPQRDEILKLLLQGTIRSGKPFDHLLIELNIENDQYLLEIARFGISTVRNLQREFFLDLLPILLESHSIPMNKIIARWVTVTKKDTAIDNKVNLLTQQLSLQNFDTAVQIIDGLSSNLQPALQKWRKKLTDHIYVHTFLKMYLNAQ